jgi:large subunit ribosomal protein L4
MPTVVLYKQDGSQVGQIELSEHVFGQEDNQQAIFDTIIAERAAMRQGTQKAKTRHEVRGGGKKHGDKKVLVELVKVQSVLHNGVVVV